MRQIAVEDVPLVKFMSLVFTLMPGESHCKVTQVFLVVFRGCFQSTNELLSLLI